MAMVLSCVIRLYWPWYLVVNASNNSIDSFFLELELKNQLHVMHHYLAVVSLVLPGRFLFANAETPMKRNDGEIKPVVQILKQESSMSIPWGSLFSQDLYAFHFSEAPPHVHYVETIFVLQLLIPTLCDRLALFRSRGWNHINTTCTDVITILDYYGISRASLFYMCAGSTYAYSFAAQHPERTTR